MTTRAPRNERRCESSKLQALSKFDFLISDFHDVERMWLGEVPQAI
jgi:hypothetical protein